MTKKRQSKAAPKKAATPVSQQEERLIDEGLNAIYGNGKVDFSKMERARSRITNILITVVVTLAVIAVTAWTAFFVYSRYFAPSQEEPFLLEIEVDEELISGEEANIRVNYQNPGKIPLASLALQVKLPAAFEPVSLSPTPDDVDELLWDLGTLSPGSDGTIAIGGTWVANVPSSTPIQVFASYRPTNFNADFSEIETVYINTLDSVLETKIEGPEEGRPGETLEYTVTIKNTGENLLQNVGAEVFLPEGFFLESSEPTVEAGAAPIFDLNSLEPLEEFSLSFLGSFAADREGFHYFDVETFVRLEQERFVQNAEESYTDVLPNDLSLQLVANGTTDDVNIKLNDVLRLSVALENTGSATLTDADLLIDFQSDLPMPLIWGDADLDGGTITSSGVVWGTSSVGAIEPGQKRLFNLSFPVDSAVGNGQTDTFDVVASSSSGALDIKSTPITVSITTEARFHASARYFDDDGIPLGSGSLPPTVNESTTYRIYWTIENALHDLENVQVVANLPTHVNWLDTYSTDLGSLTYNSETRTVTWKINQLPTTVSRVEANMALQITPDTNDVGTFVKLLSSSQFQATDSETNATVSGNSDGLDTELVGDNFAQDKGIVVK